MLWDDDDDIDIGAGDDEYKRWCYQLQEKHVYQPLNYWTSKNIRQRYPRLSRLAIDIFTIPAMSDDPERTFSSTGLIVVLRRGLLNHTAITETQCLKNWLQWGVVTTAMLTELVAKQEEQEPIAIE